MGNRCQRQASNWSHRPLRRRSPPPARRRAFRVAHQLRRQQHAHSRQRVDGLDRRGRGARAGEVRRAGIDHGRALPWRRNRNAADRPSAAASRPGGAPACRPGGRAASASRSARSAPAGGQWPGCRNARTPHRRGPAGAGRPSAARWTAPPRRSWHGPGRQRRVRQGVGDASSPAQQPVTGERFMHAVRHAQLARAKPATSAVAATPPLAGRSPACSRIRPKSSTAHCANAPHWTGASSRLPSTAAASASSRSSLAGVMDSTMVDGKGTSPAIPRASSGSRAPANATSAARSLASLSAMLSHGTGVKGAPPPSGARPDRRRCRGDADPASRHTPGNSPSPSRWR